MNARERVSGPAGPGGTADDAATAVVGYLIVPAAGLAVLLSTAVWLGGGLAALLTGHGWPPVPVTQAPLTAWRLATDGPRAAWPPPAPPAALVWALSAAVVVAGAAAAGYLLAAVLRRRGRRDGFADRAQLRRHFSRRAARRRVPTVRPSLAGRRGVDPHEYGLHIGDDTRTGIPLWSSVQDTVLIYGPPQSGKNAYLLDHLTADYRGAAIVTSTKTGVIENTLAHRQAIGPVHVLNPEELGGGQWPSTLRWSPVEGCEDPKTAIERAAMLLSGSKPAEGVRGGDFWAGSAAKVLRALLQAAALSGRTLVEVYRWTADPTDDEPLAALRGSPRASQVFLTELYQAAQAPAETRDSIYLTLAQSLSFLANPVVAQACTPRIGESFDVERFIRERGTLYLLGEEKDGAGGGSVGPLITALVAHVIAEGRRLGQAMPRRRLDPPLGFLLDECAHICRLPLHTLFPDSGGRGMTMVAVFHSPSQLREGWGKDNAETIWNSSNVKVVLGGLAVEEDLRALSALTGEKIVRSRSVSTGAGGRSYSHSEQYRPVLTGDEIRRLKPGELLVIHRAVQPVIARRAAFWERKDYRAAAKATARRGPIEMSRT